MLHTESPEALLDTALSAIRAGNGFEAALNELPVPIYLTDANGAVTYWNDACVEFAGRQPERGDKWCVSWQLYTTDGDPMKKEDCPMARAVRQQRPIRDEVAIVRRPNGSRAAFRPYPTPVFDQDGVLTGAVNMIVDISEEQAGSLADQASRCRRLACATHDRSASDVLTSMADSYEETAAALRRR